MSIFAPSFALQYDIELGLYGIWEIRDGEDVLRCYCSTPNQAKTTVADLEIARGERRKQELLRIQ